MDNQEKKNQPKENDIDLGTLLAATRKGFSRAGRSLRSGSSSMGVGIMNLIIFFKQKFFWFVLAAAAGIGWSLYNESNSTAGFKSQMTARYNFGSTLALYNTVDYLQALINESDRAQLSKLLNITEEEAGTLTAFGVEPIRDELTTSELYKRNFMLFERNQLRTDTFWTRILPYEKFKSSLTNYDFPMQRVTAASTRSSIFSKIQDGFVQLITSNENLKKNLSVSMAQQAQEADIITGSIKGLDTLRTVYNTRLRDFPNAGTGQATSINLMERAVIPASPELQLYDKMMVLKDELRSLSNFSMNNSQLVQVYAPFNPVGKKDNNFKKNIFYITLSALMIMLVILVGIEAFKMVIAYERRLKNNPAP